MVPALKCKNIQLGTFFEYFIICTYFNFVIFCVKLILFIYMLCKTLGSLRPRKKIRMKSKLLLKIKGIHNQLKLVNSTLLLFDFCLLFDFFDVIKKTRTKVVHKNLSQDFKMLSFRESFE